MDMKSFRLKKLLVLATVPILLLVGGAGHSLGADMSVPTRTALVKTVTLEAGGKPIQVPVKGNRLDLVRSADVVKKVNNQDVSVQSAEVSVKPLSPTAQCPLPSCRIVQLTAGKSASGAYQVRLKDRQKRVIKTVAINVVAPKATLPAPEKVLAMPKTSTTMPKTSTNTIAKTAQRGSVAIDTVPLPEKGLATPKSSTPMPKTSASTTAKTAQKDSVAIDTVPLPEKPMERPQTGTAITKQAPRMTYDLSQQKKSPQAISDAVTAMPALRDDRYAKSPEASKQNLGKIIGFCPTDGIYPVAEMNNCECPYRYVKVQPKVISLRKPGTPEIKDMMRNKKTLETRKLVSREQANLYLQCIPDFPCPEGPFTTKENDDGKFCKCPSGTTKTLFDYGSDYSECVSPSALYDITILLDKIHVYGDCDNLSPGDWKMIVRTETNDPGATVTPQRVWWPNANTTKNVDTGKTYENPNKTITIRNIHADRNIDLRMTGVDCDDDMLFAITSWQSLAIELAEEIIYDPFDNAPKFNCEGEEVYEYSGKHDRLGVAHKTWVGDTNVVEYTRGFVMTGSRDNTCTDGSAYTAYFMASRTRASEGSTSGTGGGTGGSYGGGSGGGGSGGNIQQHLK